MSRAATEAPAPCPPEHPEALDLSTSAGCVAAAAAWERYRVALDEWVKAERANAAKWIEEAHRRASAYSGGLDDETIRLARETVLLSPPGRYKSYCCREWVTEPLNNIQREVVADFCRRLVAGDQKLRRRYLGTKRYDRWDCQEIDCEFGMGPSHGSVTMRVELLRKWRGDEPPPAENVDAALRVMRAICEDRAPVDLLSSRGGR